MPDKDRGRSSGKDDVDHELDAVEKILKRKEKGKGRADDSEVS